MAKQCKLDVAISSDCTGCAVCKDYVCTTCKYFAGDCWCAKTDKATVLIGEQCKDHEAK